MWKWLCENPTEFRVGDGLTVLILFRVEVTLWVNQIETYATMDTEVLILFRVEVTLWDPILYDQMMNIFVLILFRVEVTLWDGVDALIDWTYMRLNPFSCGSDSVRLDILINDKIWKVRS